MRLRQAKKIVNQATVSRRHIPGTRFSLQRARFPSGNKLPHVVLSRAETRVAKAIRRLPVMWMVCSDLNVRYTPLWLLSNGVVA